MRCRSRPAPSSSASPCRQASSAPSGSWRSRPSRSGPCCSRAPTARLRRGSRIPRLPCDDPRAMRAAKARARAAALEGRRREWVDRQKPESLTGVGINSWRAYRAVDGPLQSALLSLYVLVAVLPALLVMEGYLNAATSELIHSVLSEGRAHEIGSAFLAIAGALFFGLGFGRVLQLVHARAWGLPATPTQTDPARYGLVLLALYGLILLLLVQLT